jgi:threo-3-hydroxy-L-aspartate ammonia-lyase
MDVGAKALPTIDSVRQAADRIRGVARRTPVMTSHTLDEIAGAKVFLKCENFQRVGAFKFRGAYNALSMLDAEARKRGVLTFSSGNHAQAIALAGRLLGVSTTIIMPNNAPAAKLAATRGYGAEVILFDPDERKREELAAEIFEQRGGLTIIPPYDHPDVVAGQGTAALELFEEVGDLDAIFAPCGGGGLLSGTALAAKGTSKSCRVIGVEPELADDATRSFRTGVLAQTHNPPTIADGLRTPSLGKVTFPLVLENVDEMFTVSEKEIVDAMRFLWTRMKLVVEPSGAVAVAAVMRGDAGASARSIGVIISGGNVDLQTAFALLNEEVS